jgi:hypothetical protein
VSVKGVKIQASSGGLIYVYEPWMNCWEAGNAVDRL